jgi:hypothetical protein
MRQLTVNYALAIACVGMCAGAIAQVKPSTDILVTLEVPLNLTRLQSDIVSVSVECEIVSTRILKPTPGGPKAQSSPGVRASSTVPVKDGSVVRTAKVEFAFATTQFLKGTGIPTTPSGIEASYSCTFGVPVGPNLVSFNTGQSNGNYNYKLTPSPGTLTGVFVW